MKRNRRIQSRKNMEIPILYTREYNNIYHEALTYDISRQGLSFSTAQGFSCGDCFWVKPALGPFDPVLTPDQKRWAAQVKWCQKQTKVHGYIVGIKRIDPADTPIAQSPCTAAALQCELCGTRAIEGAVNIQSGAIVCTDCFQHCYQCAGKTLQGTIDRFMTGNVI